MRSVAQYGLRDQRIGEAPNQGSPRSLLRRRDRCVREDRNVTKVEESVAREDGHVAGSGVSGTVLASVDAVRSAHGRPTGNESEDEPILRSVAVAVPDVVDCGRVVQVEFPIPMVVALSDRAESSDALSSDGSTPDTSSSTGILTPVLKNFQSRQLARKWSSQFHDLLV